MENSVKSLDELLIAETSDIDFKESLETSKPKSWLKTVSAFANALGGIILWGVCDNREIVGVSDVQKTIEKISEVIKVRIEPQIIYRVTQIEVDGKTIVKLEVRPGASTPYYYVNEGSKTCYFRLGSESIVAPAHILNELILKGKRLSYDAMESNTKFSEVSFTLFEATFKQRTRTVIDRNIDYLSFGLVHENNSLTNAGVLLSDQCNILQSRMFCTRWNGLDKGSIFDDALDDKEYNGNLISLLDSGMAFIKNNSKVKWRKTATGREDHPDYPERAVFEAIVNAIIHRDYSIIGSEVHVDMFDDRIEITSPGGMFDGKKIQEVDIQNVPSSRRNPIISDVFHRLKYMERRGSGLKKIIKEYGKEHSPSFFSDQLYFNVTLKNKNFESNESSEKGSEKKHKKSSEKILEILSQDKNSSAASVADIIGISSRAVEKHIAKMKEEGIIERVGGDRGGYWKVK